MDSLPSFFNNKPNRFKKRPSSKLPFYPLAIFFFATLLFFLFFLFSHNTISNSVLPFSRNSQCPKSKTLVGKFLMYAPHSGFSNQLSEFKNALLMAALLNRTLVVPPVLDHHAVALGSCPKFRVINPHQLRLAVWNHVFEELIRSFRYVSMADIVDLSKVMSNSSIQTIDFRVFVSKWCGVNMEFACSRYSQVQSSLFESLKQCGSELSGYDGNVPDCIYAVEDDCRTTVWTYQKDGEDGMLDIFQPDEQLKQKKNISYVRRRKDVSRTLGPDSKAGSATVLAFGSLFTAPYKGSESYIDIHEAPGDKKIQSLIENISFLPFNPEITSAGKEFSSQTIKAPFFCAQLRLLDGQFKNHWKSTFTVLKEKLESLTQKGPLPVHIFVMTDLPLGNWTTSYLGDLARDSKNFKIFTLSKEDDLVRNAARRLVAARQRTKDESKLCDSQTSPDLHLYIEESICGCASLGFVGTAGSTIAESIELIRKHRTCFQ